MDGAPGSSLPVGEAGGSRTYIRRRSWGVFAARPAP